MQVSFLTPGAKTNKQLNYVSVKNSETKYVLAENMKNLINISATFNKLSYLKKKFLYFKKTYFVFWTMLYLKMR